MLKALGERKDITTKEQAYTYLQHYAGYELKHLRQSLPGHKRANNKNIQIIQELEQQIEREQEKVQQLENKLFNYDTRLTRLEAQVRGMENQRVRDISF
ncbi:hypothetical protein [Nostoc sp.]|uniref:hypothetical protein n=1 Tax=Nostoc sp. TaxID=1180 RepID=UPI002FFC4595